MSEISQKHFNKLETMGILLTELIHMAESIGLTDDALVDFYIMAKARIITLKGQHGSSGIPVSSVADRTAYRRA